MAQDDEDEHEACERDRAYHEWLKTNVTCTIKWPDGSIEGKPPMATIAITMDEAKRILDWRAMMDVEAEKANWRPEDNRLMDKLLDFVDD